MLTKPLLLLGMYTLQLMQPHCSCCWGFLVFDFIDLRHFASDLNLLSAKNGFFG